MGEKINVYPQTSYPSLQTSFVEQGNVPYSGVSPKVKSNLSYLNCSTPPFFFYNDGLLFKDKDVNYSFDENKNQVNILNKDIFKDQYAEGFFPRKVNGNTVWYSSDPRQFRAATDQTIPLDSPPIDGDVRLKNVYQENLNNYREGFETYESIKDGQIYYYVDKSIAGPFYSPLYNMPAKEVGVLYKDPMGSMKPQYTRVPTSCLENPTTIKRDDFQGNLSFLQDTQSFREDIMSLQQQKNNQEKWSARWYS